MNFVQNCTWRDIHIFTFTCMNHIMNQLIKLMMRQYACRQYRPLWSYSREICQTNNIIYLRVIIIALSRRIFKPVDRISHIRIPNMYFSNRFAESSGWFNLTRIQTVLRKRIRSHARSARSNGITLWFDMNPLEDYAQARASYEECHVQF